MRALHLAPCLVPLLLLVVVLPLCADAFVAVSTEGWGRGRLIRSVDAGQTWTPLIECYIDLHASALPTPFSAVAVGANGTIVIATPYNGTSVANITAFSRSLTYESGGSYQSRITNVTVPSVTLWTSPSLSFAYATLNTTITSDLRSVVFLNASVGVVVGATGMILRTTDGGLTWFTIASGIIRDLNSLSFYRSKIVAVANVGTVLISDDSGLSWWRFANGTTTANNLYDVTLIDVQNIIACGHAATIAQSRDGGATWASRTVTDYQNHSFYSIAYDSDASAFYVTGSQSLLLVSYDSAVSFTLIPITTKYPQRFNSLSFSSTVRAFASRSRFYLYSNTDNGTWVASPYININSMSSLSIMEAGVLTIEPSMYNLSSFAGYDVSFNFTFYNSGSEALIVYGIVTDDVLIVPKSTQWPLVTLAPYTSSQMFYYTYQSSLLPTPTSAAVYFTNLTVLTNTPQQSVRVGLSVMIVPEPANTTTSFLSQYWWAMALIVGALTAMTLLFVRRRLQYIKKHNRRVRYEDEKISFWGCWLLGAHIEHDSDSEFWSDEEQEELDSEEEAFDDEAGDFNDEREYDNNQWEKSYSGSGDDSKGGHSHRHTGRITRRLSAMLDSRRSSVYDSHRDSLVTGRRTGRTGREQDEDDDGDDDDTDSSISDQDFQDNEWMRRRERYTVKRVQEPPAGGGTHEHPQGLYRNASTMMQQRRHLTRVKPTGGGFE